MSPLPARPRPPRLHGNWLRLVDEAAGSRQLWRELFRQRFPLAHRRLPDADADWEWRLQYRTVPNLRPSPRSPA